MTLRAPFPWFGGKSRVADVVWRAFGDVPNYVEPFFGSGAVLLGRPHEAKTETVNDRDCYLANFWRALQATPEEVAWWADGPVNEADLHARHLWLVSQDGFRSRMRSEPDYYDAKVAGWWVWGLCQWIGTGWCAEKNWAWADAIPTASAPGQRGHGRTPSQQLPHLGSAGMGVHRPSQQLPHLGDAGRGVHRPSQQLPHLGDAGRGGLRGYFVALAVRLRPVRVACGDWTRVLGDSVTHGHGTTAVFLDPPYDDGKVEYAAGGTGISSRVREWALANGDNRKLRIALCGYDGEHEMPGWTCHAWKARGGYANQGNGPNENAARERVWLSPHCLPLAQEPKQLNLAADE